LPESVVRIVSYQCVAKIHPGRGYQNCNNGFQLLAVTMALAEHCLFQYITSSQTLSYSHSPLN